MPIPATNDMYIEYIPLSKLLKAKRNPKLHSDKIVTSFEQYGYVNPMIIDESTNCLVAGHGRLEKLQQIKDLGQLPPERIKVENGEWLAPVIRGISFNSEQQADQYRLDDNLTGQVGGWDQPLLKKMIDELKPISIDTSDLKPLTNVDFTPISDIDHSQTQQPKEVTSSDPAFDPSSESPEIQNILRLDEGVVYPSTNVYGIPDLRSDMLVDKLPPNLDTWGDRQTTPDDGQKWWLFNQGTATEPGLPGDRSIISLFGWDKIIEQWWATPTYHCAKYYKMGIRMAITPDFSIWDSHPVPLQLYSVYRAAWLSRFMQEAGFYIIPRLEYFICRRQLPVGTPGIWTTCGTGGSSMHDKLCPKAYSLQGIPPNPPVIATQMQTSIDDELVPTLQTSLIEAVRQLKPQQLLVYASKKGKHLVMDIRSQLECEVVILPTVSMQRRILVNRAETDPTLKELRKRKKTSEPARTTSPDK